MTWPPHSTLECSLSLGWNSWFAAFMNLTFYGCIIHELPRMSILDSMVTFLHLSLIMQARVWKLISLTDGWAQPSPPLPQLLLNQVPHLLLTDTNSVREPWVLWEPTLDSNEKEKSMERSKPMMILARNWEFSVGSSEYLSPSWTGSVMLAHSLFPLQKRKSGLWNWPSEFPSQWVSCSSSQR
jgi:hypothetical protein